MHHEGKKESPKGEFSDFRRIFMILRFLRSRKKSAPVKGAEKGYCVTMTCA